MTRQGNSRYTPGKVIDTWVYEVKDIELEKKEYDHDGSGDREDKTTITRERVVNRKVTVEIRMEKTVTQSIEPPHPLETVKLVGTVKELGIKVEGTDLEAIRASIWSKLDKQYEIKWERFYLVEVNESRIYSGTGTGLEVSYDDVYKGTTWDGKLLMRSWRRHRDEQIEPWPGQFKRKGGKITACIEATETNREALKEFCGRLDLLREKLVELLAPQNIEQTLLGLGQLRLLPPKEEKEVKHAKST